MQDDVRSLSHSKWRCKYHIVFAPKYRRQVIYGKIKADVIIPECMMIWDQHKPFSRSRSVLP